MSGLCLTFECVTSFPRMFILVKDECIIFYKNERDSLVSSCLHNLCVCERERESVCVCVCVCVCLIFE